MIQARRTTRYCVLIAAVGACSLAIWAMNPSSRKRPLDYVRPTAVLYDERADARTDVAKGYKTALTNRRLLLVEYGANWCPSCRQLNSLMESGQVRHVLNARYVVVRVDVGRFDKNLALYRQMAGQLEMIPAIVITNPATGEVINRNRFVIPDGDPREYSSVAMANWLIINSGATKFGPQ